MQETEMNGHGRSYKFGHNFVSVFIWWESASFAGLKTIRSLANHLIQNLNLRFRIWISDEGSDADTGIDLDMSGVTDSDADTNTCFLRFRARK